ncbi:hypothetical protein [Marinomonas algicola]|uniref:hypothetical protein n=1 Tax=Marinomonas algicola TaxID=2773454 RepID=UPI00174A57B6|nr:hypothetical protein [Marinomonas algicola]
MSNFVFEDTIEKQVKKAQQRVDKLTQSLLGKVFRGELVPQDLADVLPRRQRR